MISTPLLNILLSCKVVER
uniref:Uncharacterized protein n=1 Tax=Anguilla anguilla TaxID=7936 RepID=A0A0E9TCA2_ANGAN